MKPMKKVTVRYSGEITFELDDPYTAEELAEIAEDLQTNADMNKFILDEFEVTGEFIGDIELIITE
jgi:hypothetical protein